MVQGETTFLAGGFLDAFRGSRFGGEKRTPKKNAGKIIWVPPQPAEQGRQIHCKRNLKIKIDRKPGKFVQTNLHQFLMNFTAETTTKKRPPGTKSLNKFCSFLNKRDMI
jgi:hypothetical protein